MSRWIEIPRTSRQGALKIEVPNDPWGEQFSTTAISLLPKVQANSHLALRKADIVIQFSEKIILTGDHGDTFQGRSEIIYGDAVLSHRSRKSVITSVSRVDVAVSLEAVRRAEKAFPRTTGFVNALGVALHEIEEANFFLQSTVPYKQGMVGDSAYSKNDHETIPTARALKWLKTENGCDYIYYNGFYSLA